MFFSPYWLLFALPGIVLAFWAQSRVKGAYKKYSKVRTSRGVSGADVARTLLDSQGLHDVEIEESKGLLSDHYDPRTKILRLSKDVYHNPSVAAAGIAAHEMGHALQHSSGYFPLQIRSAIVPVAQVGSTLAPWLVIIGFFLRFTTLAWLGVVLFGLAVIFTLITLPVEFDASKRAKKLLVSNGVLIGNEIDGANKVLDAAALTYVAAAVAAIGQLIYYVFLMTGGRRR
ncbi:MAG TPA: zinc metallopeptidase [candidate division Zixibacteria bacterium]|nr:zinc metallopeptidase [candidate division Zixibacteria bacterium]